MEYYGTARRKQALKQAAVGLAVIAALVWHTVQAFGPFTPADLLVNQLASPSFVDIDNDGDQDAFVGDVFIGKIRFYQNNGTAEEPVFVRIDGSFQPLNPDGATNPLAAAGQANVQDHAAPAFVDIDNDGDQDAFVGTGVAGNPIVFFRNNGTASAPNFAQVTGAANPLNGVTMRRTTPTFGDIDNDGDFDMFSGENEPGEIYFYRNTGTPTNAVFTLTRGSDPTDQNPFLIGTSGPESAPALVDIDDDGDLDLFIGNRSGEVRFFRNNKNSLTPNVDPTYTLQAGAGNPLNGIVNDPLAVEHYMPAFVDIDNDGDKDAYLGDFYGVSRLYRNTGTAASPNFGAPEPAENPLVDVLVDPASSITMGDVDGDGDRDAVIGGGDGVLAYYRNGTNGASGSFTQIGGAGNPFNSISFPNTFLIPTLVDLDNDNDRDLVLGTGPDDFLRYYRNGTTGTAGAYTEQSGAQNPFSGFSPAIVSGNPVTTFGDLDNDGDLDLIFGNNSGVTSVPFEGSLFFFRNTGTVSAPVFTYVPENVGIFYTELQRLVDNSGTEGEGDPQQVTNYYLAPELLDYDNDNDLDLIIGQRYGYFIYMRNVTVPASGLIRFERDDYYNPFKVADGLPVRTYDFSSYVRSASNDIDGDGDLDTFVSSELGNIRFHRNLAAPAQPHLVAGAASATSITLSWDVLPDPLHPNTPTSYVLERSPNGTTGWAGVGGPNSDGIHPGDLTGSYTDSGLTLGTPYFYRIRPVYATTGSVDNDPSAGVANNTAYGAYSAVAAASPATTLGAPSGLTAVAAAGPAANLSWTDNSTSETGFRIERAPNGTTGWEQVGTAAANATNFSDLTVEAGRTYFYRVFATQATNSSLASNVSNVVIPLVAPTSLAATVVAPSVIELEWSDTNGGETGFQIERAPAVGGPFTLIATTAPNTTSYRNTGLAASTSYFYRVRATGPGGPSAYSNVANADTPLTAPTSLGITVVSPTQLDLNWSDANGGETGFEVERSADGVNGWTQITTTGPNVTTHSDTGLTNGTTYFYRVRAVRNAETSAYSNVASATTGTPLAAPTNLTATTASIHEIDLSWADNTSDETGFQIERSPDGTTGWTTVSTTAANVTTFNDNGLEAATTYFYRVRTVRNTETSVPSNIANATTSDVPAAPGTLTATVASNNQIDLSWSDNSTDETGFEIERSADGVSGWTQIATTGANTTTFSNTGLNSGTTYFYRVRAARNAEHSAYSNVAQATTTGTPEYRVYLPLVVR